MFKDFTGLASHFLHKRREAEAAELAARREEARRRQEEKVVGGVYRPEPVNKEAAMLLAKAPWFFHPPQGDPKFDETKQQKQEKDNESRKNQIALQNGEPKHMALQRKKQDSAEDVAQRLCGNAEENQKRRIPMNTKTNNDKSPMIRGMSPKFNGNGDLDMESRASEIRLAIQRSAPKEMTELARIAIDSRKVLHESAEDIGEIIADFDRMTRSAAQEVRSKRMMIVADCSSMVNALKDVRQFFLGPDYERETKRLAEFVDLCERLKTLKDSGFLDTVADTMIRLAAYEKA